MNNPNSDDIPTADEVYVAEEVQQPDVIENPFGAPTAETSAGSTRPRLENWSQTIFLSLAFGVIVALAIFGTAMYFIIDGDPELTGLTVILASLLAATICGVLVFLFTMRRISKQNLKQANAHLDVAERNSNDT